MTEEKKNAKCKCGHDLVITNGFPRWVYCENPPCDYVQIWGDYIIDSMLGRFSENSFAKEGDFKDHYEGSLLLLTIDKIKPMYDPDAKELEL